MYSLPFHTHFSSFLQLAHFQKENGIIIGITGAARINLFFKIGMNNASGLVGAVHPLEWSTRVPPSLLP